MTHSPEPWKHDGMNIYDNEGNKLYGEPYVGIEPHSYDMDRICAAVNFCQHIPTELLERLVEARVGAKDFIVWTDDAYRFMGKELCECVNPGEHDVHEPDCLLKAALDLIGEDS